MMRMQAPRDTVMLFAARLAPATADAALRPPDRRSRSGSQDATCGRARFTCQIPDGAALIRATLVTAFSNGRQRSIIAA
jgi:hypothetical protein